MTDETPENELFEEAMTPGRSMTGAAEDLSSLFGEEAGHDPASTALGPRRTPPPPPVGNDPSAALGILSQRLGKLEEDLAEAVGKIQGVDRHLATTFQGLQAIFDKLQEAPALTTEVAAGFTDLGERLGAVEGQLRGHSRSDPDAMARLASIELALASALDRLGSLEAGVALARSQGDAGRAGIESIQQSLAELRSFLGWRTEPPPLPVPAAEAETETEASPPPPPVEPAPPPPAAETALTVVSDADAGPELAELVPDAPGQAGPTLVPAPEPPEEPREADEASAGARPAGAQTADPDLADGLVELPDRSARQEALYWDGTANESQTGLSAPQDEPEKPSRPPFWRPAEPSA